MKIAVSGANGFVGRALVPHLRARGHAVLPLVRRACGIDGEIVIADPLAATAWAPALDGCAAVIHLAARAHHPAEHAAGNDARYQADNVHTTQALAGAALGAGVGRFVLLSSLKVHGDRRGRACRADDVPAPHGPYANSKWQAERELRRLARGQGMAVTVLRPPLVYGPGVRANFRSLVDAIASGRPLPLGAIRNRRSLIGLDNLCSAIETVTRHPAAAGGTFLPCDGPPVSTPQLVTAVAAALSRPPRLWPVPPWLLRLGARLLGREADAARLLDSLWIDPDGMSAALAWQAPCSFADGLAAMFAAAHDGVAA